MISGGDLARWRQEAVEAAREAGVSPLEVDWLLQAFSSLDRLTLRLELFKAEPEIKFSRSWAEIESLWEQRLRARVPLQYLVGKLSWREFELQVNCEVLIPRPETEGLVDLALGSEVAQWGGDWVDLGTGSGAIALSLARALPTATIHAVDYSPSALQVAYTNAVQHHLEHRICFYSGSWFEPLQSLQGKLVAMVANPPYIPTALIPHLQPEVALHEPHLALDGGEDGLHCIRTLITLGPRYLQPGGLWLIEMMAGQASEVSALLAASEQYRDIQIYRDFAGIERFALAYRV